MAAELTSGVPELATMTGSTTNGVVLCSRISAMATMCALVWSMPVFIACMG